ncbi:hypothetical protein [Streptomyces flaveolus]|uniref:hypothetical protein n=1 Tax=Streptomyces flaveolus TaxID=67297 RepID=UPI003811399B
MSSSSTASWAASSESSAPWGCALLVVHDCAAVRVECAPAGCEQDADRAERVLRNLAGPPPAHIPVAPAPAVVELREADDAASGEQRPAGIDPALLATTEQRACRLLARLHRPPAVKRTFPFSNVEH